jgi:hypothetical protein
MQLIKKTLLWFFGAFLILGAIGSSSVWYLIKALPDMCDSNIAVELNADNQLHRATVFEYSCGATTGFTAHVSVLKPHQKLLDESSIFVAGNAVDHDGKPQIRIQWLDNSTLKIQYPEQAKAIRKESQVGSLQVQYSTFKP